MNAIKYLRNRFEFAAKGNGTIKVNNQDIEAINILIESEKKRKTDLEDALLLYYLFCNYHIENENNALKLKENGLKFPIGLTPAYDILNKLSIMLNPKSFMIEKITQELTIYQEYERIPKDKELYKKELEHGISKEGEPIMLTKQDFIPIPKEERIKKEDVELLVNNTLSKVKNEFPKFNGLIHGAWNH